MLTRDKIIGISCFIDDLLKPAGILKIAAGKLAIVKLSLLQL